MKKNKNQDKYIISFFRYIICNGIFFLINNNKKK